MHTYVVGIIRATKKLLTKEVMNASLRREDGVEKEYENGIVFLKWKKTLEISDYYQQRTNQNCLK